MFDTGNEPKHGPEWWMETFMLGILSGAILAAFGGLLYAIASDWKTVLFVMACIVGGVFGVFALGYTVRNTYGILTSKEGLSGYLKRRFTEKDPVAPSRSFQNPTLDTLAQLEDKYGVSTLMFLAGPEQWVHIRKIDVLDYISWIGLVNELPSVVSDEVPDGQLNTDNGACVQVRPRN